MTILETYDELQVPCYALPYLVNGDSSGLESQDLRAIRTWFREFEDMAQNAYGEQAQVIFSPDNDNSYFTNSPVFGLACDCQDCTILIVK